MTGTFTISDASAYNHEESIDANLAIKAKTSAVDVTITMKDYTATVLVDDVATTEDSATITYDGNAHTFVVVTDPSATVKYTVDGVAEDSVSVTNPGTYTIKYWTEQEANGYTALAEKTFTLTITNECDYVVEVSETADYVAGYKLVLVYTNTDNVTFEYGGKLMIDVTSRGYKYDGVSYNHVYAFVTPALDETFDLDAYKDLIQCNIPGKDGLYTMPAYTTDLNFDGDMTVLDISTGYGIYNAIDTYMAEIKYQKNILRADTNGDKKVDTADTAAVVNAVKAAKNTANNG